MVPHRCHTESQEKLRGHGRVNAITMPLSAWGVASAITTDDELRMPRTLVVCLKVMWAVGCSGCSYVV